MLWQVVAASSSTFSPKRKLRRLETPRHRPTQGACVASLLFPRVVLWQQATETDWTTAQATEALRQTFRNTVQMDRSAPMSRRLLWSTTKAVWSAPFQTLHLRPLRAQNGSRGAGICRCSAILCLQVEAMWTSLSGFLTVRTTHSSRWRPLPM